MSNFQMHADESHTQEPGLELAMQELEAMEAPGFWTGFTTGVTISTAGIASYVASAAVVTT